MGPYQERVSEDLRMSEAAGMPAGGSGLSEMQIYIEEVSISYIESNA